MISGILGIDLGTSSVKLIFTDGARTYKSGERYESADPEGWWSALCRAARGIPAERVRAVGLSSQVGTYVTSGGECIGWSEPVGRAELDGILSEIPREEFEREISMPHPLVASYPLPRLKYIKEKHPDTGWVCMPKDILCERLTGRRVTDVFSWRGLANLREGHYSEGLLKKLSLSGIELPYLASPFDLAGGITEGSAAETGLPKGIPVYIGCNDFFSGLIGMGIGKVGDMFDITGTSEHLGIVRADIPKEDGGLVCGPYFFENVHYGVTASGGCSFDLAASLCELSAIDAYASLERNPPIFLPYLCGERAPIWDSDSRGVYFGLEKGCRREELAYSAAEGVVFSIYHIYECMGRPEAECMITAGGAGRDPMLNKMKASLFGLPVMAAAEKDSSALGAVICAAVGSGACADLREAMDSVCEYSETAEPDEWLGERLLERFEIYKRLYPALKNEFQLLKGVRK